MAENAQLVALWEKLLNLQKFKYLQSKTKAANKKYVTEIEQKLEKSNFVLFYLFKSVFHSHLPMLSFILCIISTWENARNCHHETGNM